MGLYNIAHTFEILQSFHPRLPAYEFSAHRAVNNAESSREGVVARKTVQAVVAVVTAPLCFVSFASSLLMSVIRW